MMVVSLILIAKVELTERINRTAMLLTSSQKNYFAFNYDGCPVNFFWRNAEGGVL
jgi:hypothetical protein